MSLMQDEHGSFTHADDPGEPQTGVPRVSVTRGEADFLAWLAVGRSVLEIGSGLGISAMSMEITAVALATVDPDPWVHEHTWPRLCPQTERFTERPEVESAFARWNMVFIDGDHDPEALRADLAYAHAICRRGVIVAHDTNAPHIRLTCIDTGWDWTFVNTHHGLGISYVGWDE